MRPMEHGADVNITALVILERQLSAGIVLAYSNGRLADISAFESFALVKSEDQGTMKFAFKGWHGGIELELGDAVESAQADIRHKPGCDTIASVVPPFGSRCILQH